MALPFAKYSALSIIRNPRRTVFSLIGIVLAVTLIAGEGISIDTSLALILQRELDQVTYDFMGAGSLSPDLQEINTAVSDISAVDGVTNAAAMVNLDIKEISCNNRPTYSSVSGIDSKMIAVKDKLHVKGEIIVSATQVTVNKYVAEGCGAKVGDTIQIVIWIGNSSVTKNYTLASIVDMEDGGYGGGGMLAGVLMSISEAIQFHILSHGSSSPIYVYIFIWGDRPSLVDPSDPAKTEINLKRMARKIQNVASPHDIYVDFNPALIVSAETLSGAILWLRILFIVLSLPVIILSIYLGVLGADLGHSERRREIGILKSRGASSAHIYSLLMGETIVLGTIAGFLGLIFGMLVSQLMLYTSGQIFGLSISGPTLVGFSISSYTVAGAMVFGVIFMLVANYRPAKRTSSITLNESLQAYSSEETKIEYKPKNDIIFVTLGVTTYILTLLYVDYLTKGSGGALSGMLIAFLCIGVILVILIPLSPLFLIVGATRLATRLSPKLYEFASHSVRPFTKELWPIVKKNIARNPKRASTVCLLITIALSFGLFVSVTFDSQKAFEERTVHASIGGDIQVAARYSSSLPTIGNESNIPGAVSWSSISFISVRTPESMSTGLAVFDADRYFSIAKPDQAAFIDGDPGSALSALVSGRAVIMTQSFANSYAYGRGDQILMTFPSGGSIRFSIAAIVKYLPGLSGGGYGGPYYYGYSFFVHSNQIPYPDRGTPTVELFDIDDPLIPKAAEYMRDNYGGSIDVKVYNEEIASIRDNPISGATYNFLNLEYAFALIVIAIGLGMIMFMAMIERKQEVANMIARGASIKDIMALTSGEGITIGLVGLLLGTIIGLSTAYVFNTMFGMMFNAGSIVPREVMLSWGSLWVILATVGILLLTSVLILIPLKRINLNEILRWRGG